MAKTELEEAGLETEGMVESTAKLRSEILALTGVDIMDGANQFKSTYAIMDELAAKWKDLTDIQQATVTELIAGKRQGNIVSSLMTNFDTARDALETSINSSGSAMREHEKWQQSLEAQINKLKSSWQSLSQSFLKSDFLKGALDAVIGLVDGLNTLIDTFGTLPTLLSTVAAGFSLFKNKGLFTFDKDANSIRLFGTQLTSLKDKYTQIQTAISRYNSVSSKSASFQAAYNKTLQTSSTSIGNYLRGLNGAKGSVRGYVASLIGAKAATIGLQIATTALNAALTMGISMLVSWAIDGVMKLVNANKELAESVDELISKFEEQHNELKKLKGDYDTSNESSMISKYGKLSKGVDGLGRNVSLTADEYSEYQSIVSSIADQIPSLIVGYDEQGNALLSVKGNVEELTKAYEKLIHAQNQEILTNAGDIEKDFANTMKKQSGDGAWSDNHGFWAGIAQGLGVVGLFSENYDLKTDTVQGLEKLLNETDEDKIKKIYNGLKTDHFSREEIRTALERANVDIGFWDDPFEVLEDTLEKDPAKIKGIIDDYYSQFVEAVEEQKTIAKAKLSEAFDVRSSISELHYENISEDLQAVAYQTIGSLDETFFANLQKDGKTVEQWTTEMLNQLNSISDVDNKQIETGFELQTQFNGGDISYGDYVESLKDVKTTIDGLNLKDEAKTQLKLSLGLDDDGIVGQYDAMVKRLTDSKNYDFNIAEKEAKKFLDGLSSEELSVAVDVITRLSNNGVSETIEQLQSAINREMAVQGLVFDLNIEVETAGIEAVNTALQESVSATGLSSESIDALKSRYADLESEGYNLSAMFEETSNGIHLNKKAVSELEQAYAKQKQSDIEADLKALKKEYDNLTVDIDKCTSAQERASLYVQRDAIIQQINDAATLAAQYEGLTSAYSAWLAAEEAGSERDMYENIIEGFETVGDEISRGWIDDGTIKFLELLTGKTDLAGKSGKELKKIYDGLDSTIKNTTYSISDFFTVDEDGNSTNTGVYNFLDAIGQLEEEAFGGKDVVKRDKDGNVIGFDFEIAAKKDENGNVIKNGDQVIAEALGISEELVQIMVRAADDAGFVVNLEGAYTQLADLKTEAETARDTLISLQKNGLAKLKDVDVNFNLDAEGNDLVDEQEKAVKLLDKFKKDGKIDLEMEGAQQALDIAEYLTIKLDDLTEPKIMQIDVSEVDEDLRDPIEKMQEIVKLSKEKNLVSLTGDKEEIKETQKEINEVAKELEELDPEIKAQVGIDEGWDAETIASKIEKGEVEIPAELELDVQMSDDLKDMRLMMMKQLGLATEDEVKLKVGFDIDESLVDSLDDKQQKVVVEYITKNKKEFDKLTEEEKEVVVKLIADGVDLDKYKPEDKEAIVNYIANGEEADGWTPEAKDAFVKYLVDGGEPDKFDPENKDSWVVYDTDTTKPDGYDPKDPNATVTYEKDTSDIDSYNPPNFIRTVTYKIKEIASKIASGGKRKAAQRTGANPDGKGGVNGTANVNGTTGRAFKQGSWGTKSSGTALMGELGRETLVRNGKYFTVGDNGAEFIEYQKGDIIFNHRQTEELFKNGKVTSGGGRGKALAIGTAFASGSSGYGGGLSVSDAILEKVAMKGAKKAAEKAVEKINNRYSPSGSSGSGNSPSGSSGSGGGNNAGGTSAKLKADSESSEKDKFEETIDFVEIALSRIGREIDNLDQKTNNVYKSWSDRNSALSNEINKVGDEIALQQSAAQEYLKEANQVGLSESYAKKIRDGSLNIEDFEGENDEKLVEKIKDYQQWYEKYLDCIDAAEELREQESKLYEQRFENVQAQYDAILQGYEHTESMLNEYISQAEAQGHIVSKKYYDALINNEKQNINTLKQEQSALIAERDKAVADGKVTKYSEAWYNMCAEIDGVTQAIEEGTTALIEYDKAMRDIDWETFDLIQQRISDVTAESEFLIELMSNKDLFDDNGKPTEQGAATMGLHALNYNTSMYQADDYGKQVAEIDKQLANGYSKDLEERRRELLELQRESILAAEGEKNAIKDLVEEGINLELDALQERIDLHNEELDSMKDLYDYQKDVEEQTKNIASLRKQLSAYEGFDNEESRAKIQELKVSLEEAEADLQETEYDKFISDQTALLDTLYTEYETILNSRLGNIDFLLEQVIDGVNMAAGSEGTLTTALGENGAIALALGNGATSIGETLKTEVGNVGTKLSTAMSNIWLNDGSGKAILDMYGKDFQNKQTTTNDALNKIKADVAAMVDDVDKDAQKKVETPKTQPSTKADPTKDAKPTTNADTNKNNDKSSGDGKPKLGDKVKFVSGKYYYDSQGKKPLGSKNQGKEVYITSINTKSWATHPYHISTGKKLGSGDLGWLKLDQLSGYATGKKNIANGQYAWTQEDGREYIVRPSDGAILTPIAKGDSVLNATASGNIWNMANNPAEFIKNNLGLDTANVPNGANIQSNYTQHLDKVVFNLPNVKNYEELLSAMQKDKNFEKLILSMSIDRIAGKSSLAKGKSVR